MEDSIVLKNSSSFIAIDNVNNSTYQEVLDISSTDVIKEFKIILVGNPSVGKTSIFHRFITEKYTTNYKATLTVEFKTKYVKIDNNLFVKLNIWDTCGSENFRSLTSQYYRKAHAIVLIFDLTDEKSFEDLKKIWLVDIKNHANENIEIIIVGNKLDLFEQRQVKESDVQDFCQKNKYNYIEASAKEGTNILKIFEELSFVLSQKYENQIEEKDETLSFFLKEKKPNENTKKTKKTKKQKQKEEMCC